MKISNNCLLCKIVAGDEPSKKILETEDFLVIENKYPEAPVHVLVVDKEHREKEDTLAGQHPAYWDKMLAACSKAIQKLGLDSSGYKIVNNGAGYNHFEHEHIHIMGGLEQ